MPTTDQQFWPQISDQDGSWGTDVRKLDSAAGANNNTTVCQFGTSGGNKDIIVDPFTVNSTAGLTGLENFGWAWNATTAPDEIGATALVERVIPSGTWTFSVVAVSNVITQQATYHAVVYKVSSSGTRTQLFTANTGLFTPGIGTTREFTSEQPSIVLEAGETIHISYWVNGNSVAITGNGMQFRINPNAWVQVPSPGIRSNYNQTDSLKGEGKIISKRSNTFTVTVFGKGNLTQQKETIASKTFNLKGIGFNVRDNNRIKMFFDLFGEGIASLDRETISAKTFNLTGKGIANRNELIAVLIPRTIKGQGTSSLNNKSVIASKDFDLLGEGNITEDHPVAASRTFNLIGEGKITKDGSSIELDSFDLLGEGNTNFSRSVIASKNFNLQGKGFIARDNNRIRVFLEVLGEGKLSLDRETIVSKNFNLKGDGLASATRDIQLVDFNLLGEGNIEFVRALIASKSFDLVGEGAASRDGLLAMLLPRDILGKGSVTEVHPIQAFRTFNLIGEGSFKITGSNASTIEIPIDEIPTEGGGAPIVVVRKPIFIFDD